LTGSLHELVKIDRLADIAIGTQAVTLDDVPLFLG
jgi:hypothetical protein